LCPWKAEQTKAFLRVLKENEKKDNILVKIT
jgi:hypothetical protein